MHLQSTIWTALDHCTLVCSPLHAAEAEGLDREPLTSCYVMTLWHHWTGTSPLSLPAFPWQRFCRPGWFYFSFSFASFGCRTTFFVIVVSGWALPAARSPLHVVHCQINDATATEQWNCKGAHTHRNLLLRRRAEVGSSPGSSRWHTSPPGPCPSLWSAAAVPQTRCRCCRGRSCNTGHS